MITNRMKASKQIKTQRKSKVDKQGRMTRLVFTFVKDEKISTFTCLEKQVL